MSRYELIMVERDPSGQTMKEYIKGQYDSHKHTYNLSKELGSTSSYTLARGGCLVWCGFYNNDIKMYRKGHKIVRNELNNMMNDLLFNPDKKSGIFQLDPSKIHTTLNINNTEGIRTFGIYMKENEELISTIAKLLQWI